MGGKDETTGKTGEAIIECRHSLCTSSLNNSHHLNRGGGKDSNVEQWRLEDADGRTAMETWMLEDAGGGRTALEPWRLEDADGRTAMETRRLEDAGGGRTSLVP